MEPRAYASQEEEVMAGLGFGGRPSDKLLETHEDMMEGAATGHAEREKRARIYSAGVADGKAVAREDGRSIEPSQQIRIEALRAAAVVCEGIARPNGDGSAPDSNAVGEYTKHLAEQFAAWLEK